MVSIHGTPFDPVPVQYVFPVALGQARVPQSATPVQPLITQSQALVHVTSPQPLVPEHETWQRPALIAPVAIPQVTSLHALVPEHPITQSAVPQVMLLHADVPLQVIVQDVAPVQSMLSQAPPLHVMSQWRPGGHVTGSPPLPMMVHVGGLAVVSQPPLHWAGHVVSSTTQ